jgi:hypothetical protein
VAFGTDTTLTVVAGPDSFSPDPVACGAPASAQLTATVTNPPQVQQEGQIATLATSKARVQAQDAVQLTGPTWRWVIETVQFVAPGTQSWTAGDPTYYQVSIDHPDTSVADAMLNAKFFRAGTWHVGLSVTAAYSDNLGDIWGGTGDEYISDLDDLNVTVQVRRTGSGEAFASTAIVAAGGLTPDIHKADVMLQATPAVAGTYIGALTLTDAGGQTRAATVGMNGAVTDANGQLTGTFTSSDVVGGVGIVVHDIDPADDALFVTPAADQHWDDVTEDADWTYPPNAFCYGKQSQIAFKPAMVDPEFPAPGYVPITGHTILFSAAKVEIGRASDPSTLKDPGASTPADLVDFSSATETVGVYTTKVTVNYDINYIVQNVHFKVQDADAYKP